MGDEPPGKKEKEEEKKRKREKESLYSGEEGGQLIPNWEGSRQRR